ncbi:MAG: proline--tRNA ligase, partial [Dehalococcoidia bacterium]
RMSSLFGRTLREAPAEAETDNYKLLLRAGLVAQLSAGIYSYLPLALRSLRKIEQIIRDEMDAAGAQELLMPALQPLELWQETGRDQAYGPVLFRLADRRGHELVLAPTHEEAVTDLFRRNVQSYRELPVRVYQIQTKFRDEPRPRGGLVRVRQFTMKDAYSFDTDETAFQASYDAMAVAYRNIFRRCGVPVIPVEADSGAIGGKVSQEFIFLSQIGEDHIALCPSCGYAANQERAEFHRGAPASEQPQPLEEVDTPGVTTIPALAAFLDIPPAKTAKAAFFLADSQPIFALIRGDLEINEVKLMNTLGARDLRPMTEAEVADAGWIAGYASPVGLADVRVIADISIPDAPNLVAGANKTNAHLRNVNHGRDWSAETVADIGLARAGDPCPKDCSGTIELQRGIELGHIFRLGTVYSEAMNARYADADGDQKAPIMGCYGIGVERLLAAAIEAHHDEQGIRWPSSIAPYDVHIVAIGMDNAEVRAAVARAEADLEAAGFAVMTDDRDERPGVKFNDADLLGMPLRLTLSPRNCKDGVVEFKRRDEAAARKLPGSELVAGVRDALERYAQQGTPA